MADDKEKDPAVDQEPAGKKKAPADGASDAAKDARVKELEAENQKLKAQLAELQKELETLRAKEKAAANKARAEKLIKKLEKSGLSFEGDAEREKELERLGGLSDEAFAAAEATYQRLPKPEAQGRGEDTSQAADEKAGKKGEGQAVKEEPDAKVSVEGTLRTDAGVKPLVVDDKKLSLEDRLKRGFQAAYEERVSAGV